MTINNLDYYKCSTSNKLSFLICIHLNPKNDLFLCFFSHTQKIYLAAQPY